MKAHYIAGSILKDDFVRDVLIDDFNSAGIKSFVKYSIPRHTTDTNVTEFNRPIGTHCKAKGLFSNKLYITDPNIKGICYIWQQNGKITVLPFT